MYRRSLVRIQHAITFLCVKERSHNDVRMHGLSVRMAELHVRRELQMPLYGKGGSHA